MSLLKRAMNQSNCETKQTLLNERCPSHETDIWDLNTVDVFFKATHELTEHPKKATEYAGAYDVKVTRIEYVAPNFVICWLGFECKIPDHLRLMLQPRSSFVNYNWILQNTPGLGDSDFVNEYSFRFRAIPTCVKLSDEQPDINNTKFEMIYDEFPYKVGDRIGQIYLEEIIPMHFVNVNELPVTGRTGGYGHTGK